MSPTPPSAIIATEQKAVDRAYDCRLTTAPGTHGISLYKVAGPTPVEPGHPPGDATWPQGVEDT
ncbi:hypothetical protein WBG99_15860 [Streptomyces sp. TG1A-60]|uniref:hypothetical protein n=1 Tax=Streptomyces sp. TG1A-60 TaxID=3129111 RepID=UPI0030D1C3BF